MPLLQQFPKSLKEAISEGLRIMINLGTKAAKSIPQKPQTLNAPARILGLIM
jgi:hypothetical protein